MRMACAYLEGTDIFESEARHRPASEFIDPRVSKQHF